MKDYKIYTDHELVEAIQNDDDKIAFEQLFIRYWCPLVKHALKVLPTNASAEEVVQNLFINFWQKRNSTQIDNISNYLFTSVKNGCISTLRTLLQKEKFWQHYKNSIPDLNNSVESAYINQEQYVELEKLISELSPNAQQIVKMKLNDGLTLREITVKLNCSQRMVVYHLEKSMKFLKLRYNKL